MSEQFSIPQLTEISVKQLATRLVDRTDEVQLIDVREPQEIALAHLEGFDNLPLSEFAQWSDTIHTRFNPDTETLVLCHHGIRSAQMCHWLLSQGFTNVKNIAGGIDAYSAIVDRTIPRY